MEEYTEFCMLHNIDVITMEAKFYNDKLSKIANRYNLQIFVHTVNDEDAFIAFVNNGVGVYTDLTDYDFLED